MTTIAYAKEVKNFTIGEVGLLFNLDKTAKLFGGVAPTARIDFKAPPAGWLFYGLTGQDTKFTTDIKTYDAMAGVPEFILRRFVVGLEGTLSASFKEADREIHDLISGDHNVKNLGPVLTSALAITTIDPTNRKITITPPASQPEKDKIKVGNTFILAPETTSAAGTKGLAYSTNAARITAIDTSGGTTWTLTFNDGQGGGWFRTAPAVLPTGDETLKLQTYYYGLSTIGSSTLDEIQALAVFQSVDGNQFLYHFPRVAITPNINPSFGSTSEVFTIPLEAKLLAVDSSFNGDFSGTEIKKVLGFFYELFYRF